MTPLGVRNLCTNAGGVASSNDVCDLSGRDLVTPPRGPLVTLGLEGGAWWRPPLALLPAWAEGSIFILNKTNSRI